MRISSIAKACICGGTLRFDTRDGITVQECGSCGHVAPMPRVAAFEHPVVAADLAEHHARIQAYRSRFPLCATPDCENHVSQNGVLYCTDCAKERRRARRSTRERAERRAS